MEDTESLLQSLKPFEHALIDFLKGNTEGTLYLHRDDGFTEELPVKSFFRKESEFTPLERQAISLCEGKILDIGAGAGPHSLVLQKKGHKVYALDILPEACSIMEERGVKNVICANFLDLEGKKFDTLLLLGRSICMVGDLKGLDLFFSHAYKVLKDEGKIILDSGDVTQTNKAKHLTYQQQNVNSGRYIGEIRLRFQYNGLQGPPYRMIHIEPNILLAFASKHKFTGKIVSQAEDGTYLAVLMKE